MRVGYHEVEVMVGDVSTNRSIDLVLEKYLVDAETVQEAIEMTEEFFKKQNTPFKVVKVTPSVIWGVLN
jgi:hypothetical protein